MLTEKEIIHEWKTSDFSSFNESSVREFFIKDLIYLLGYSKNTVNDIFAEKSLKLSESFQRIGRKRVDIDYVPTIRLKAFWILEAKPGTYKEMDIGDMLQAYLYATHPEIQASYIVLCNGWELKIFDVQNYENWKEPIFTINQDNCDSKFDELRSILGAESILKFQREDLLRKIHNTFEVEVDESQLTEFCRKFEEDKKELKKTVKDNAKKLWRNEWEKSAKAEEERLRSLSDKELINHLELRSLNNKAVDEYILRIDNSIPEDRAKLLRLLSQTYLGRANSQFKCRYLNILIHVLQQKLEVASLNFLRPVEEEIKDVIVKNLNYWRENDLQNALCFLDRACCKLSAVIVKNGAMDFALARAEDKKKSLPKEVRLSHNISTAHEVVPMMFCVADGLWNEFCHLNTADEINKNTAIMYDLADRIVKEFGVREYPEKEHDLFDYEYFGNEFDYLSSVTYNIVYNNYSLIKNLDLDKELMGKIMTRDYQAIIPKFDYAADITKEERDGFVIHLIRAVNLGDYLYNGILEMERNEML